MNKKKHVKHSIRKKTRRVKSKIKKRSVKRRVKRKVKVVRRRVVKAKKLSLTKDQEAFLSKIIAKPPTKKVVLKPTTKSVPKGVTKGITKSVPKSVPKLPPKGIANFLQTPEGIALLGSTAAAGTTAAYFLNKRRKTNEANTTSAISSSTSTGTSGKDGKDGQDKWSRKDSYPVNNVQPAPPPAPPLPPPGLIKNNRQAGPAGKDAGKGGAGTPGAAGKNDASGANGINSKKRKKGGNDVSDTIEGTTGKKGAKKGGNDVSYVIDGTSGKKSVKKGGNDVSDTIEGTTGKKSVKGQAGGAGKKGVKGGNDVSYVIDGIGGKNNNKRPLSAPGGGNKRPLSAPSGGNKRPLSAPSGGNRRNGKKGANGGSGGQNIYVDATAGAAKKATATTGSSTNLMGVLTHVTDGGVHSIKVGTHVIQDGTPAEIQSRVEKVAQQDSAKEGGHLTSESSVTSFINQSKNGIDTYHRQLSEASTEVNGLIGELTTKTAERETINSKITNGTGTEHDNENSNKLTGDIAAVTLGIVKKDNECDTAFTHTIYQLDYTIHALEQSKNNFHNHPAQLDKINTEILRLKEQKIQILKQYTELKKGNEQLLQNHKKNVLRLAEELKNRKSVINNVELELQHKFELMHKLNEEYQINHNKLHNELDKYRSEQQKEEIAEKIHEAAIEYYKNFIYQVGDFAQIEQNYKNTLAVLQSEIKRLKEIKPTSDQIKVLISNTSKTISEITQNFNKIKNQYELNEKNRIHELNEKNRKGDFEESVKQKRMDLENKSSSMIAIAGKRYVERKKQERMKEYNLIKAQIDKNESEINNLMNNTVIRSIQNIIGKEPIANQRPRNLLFQTIIHQPSNRSIQEDLEHRKKLADTDLTKDIYTLFENLVIILKENEENNKLYALYNRANNQDSTELEKILIKFQNTHGNLQSFITNSLLPISKNHSEKLELEKNKLISAINAINVLVYINGTSTKHTIGSGYVGFNNEIKNIKNKIDAKSKEYEKNENNQIKNLNALKLSIEIAISTYNQNLESKIKLITEINTKLTNLETQLQGCKGNKKCEAEIKELLSTLRSEINNNPNDITIERLNDIKSSLDKTGTDITKNIEVLQNVMATLIQKRARGVIGRKQVGKIKEENEKERLAREKLSQEQAALKKLQEEITALKNDITSKLYEIGNFNVQILTNTGLVQEKINETTINEGIVKNIKDFIEQSKKNLNGINETKIVDINLLNNLEKTLKELLIMCNTKHVFFKEKLQDYNLGISTKNEGFQQKRNKIVENINMLRSHDCTYLNEILDIIEQNPNIVEKVNSVENAIKLYNVLDPFNKISIDNHNVKIANFNQLADLIYSYIETDIANYKITYKSNPSILASLNESNNLTKPENANLIRSTDRNEVTINKINNTINNIIDNLSEYNRIKDKVFPVRIVINFAKRLGNNNTVDTTTAENNYTSSIAGNGIIHNILNPNDRHYTENGKKIEVNQPTYGPYYNVTNTDCPIKNERCPNAYNISEDINNCLTSNEKHHLIYSAFGFSGSGKTFTIIPQTENGRTKNPHNILYQINEILNGKIEKCEYNIFDIYGETSDGKCNVVPHTFPDKYRTDIALLNLYNNYKENNRDIAEHKSTEKHSGYTTDLQDLATKLHDFEIQRKRPEKLSGSSRYAFRIRTTPNNDDSSRSFLFVDLHIKTKKVMGVDGKELTPSKDIRITLIDMAGNEDEQTIQDAYFVPVNTEYDTTGFEKSLENMVNVASSLKDVVSSNDNSRLNSLIKSYKSSSNGKNFPTLKIDPPIDLKRGNFIKTDAWEKLEKNIGGYSEFSDMGDFINNYNLNNYKKLLYPISYLYHNWNTQLGMKLKNTTKASVDATMASFYDGYGKTANMVTEDAKSHFVDANDLLKLMSDINIPVTGDLGGVLNTLYTNTGWLFKDSDKTTLSKDLKEVIPDMAKELQRVMDAVVASYTPDLKQLLKFYKSQFNMTWSGVKRIADEIDIINKQTLTWNIKYLNNVHCSLRYQGVFINNILNDMKQGVNLLQQNNVLSANSHFPLKNVKNTVTGIKVKFVLFTNIRLDFNTHTLPDTNQLQRVNQNFKDFYARSLYFSNNMNPLRLDHSVHNSFGRNKFGKRKVSSKKKLSSMKSVVTKDIKFLTKFLKTLKRKK